jgi:hypothetical protein
LKYYATIYGWLCIYIQELIWNLRCMIPVFFTSTIGR